MTEIPFYNNVEYEDNQIITILDVRDFSVLFYVSHFEGNFKYAYTDKIGIWDIDGKAMGQYISVEVKWAVCSGILSDSGAYISMINCSDPQLNNWKIIKVLAGDISVLDEGNSRSLSEDFRKQYCLYLRKPNCGK